ncbi:MAG: STAS domain-containing protein [Paucibacter sp.]|nr:STAS domain-containing protein [Roseateles sp.]
MDSLALKLPARLRMDDVSVVWSRLEASLRAEAAQIRNGAGERLLLSAAELSDFDSSALSVLLGAARICAAESLRLEVDAAPRSLQDLARVYGVGELLGLQAAGT